MQKCRDHSSILTKNNIRWFDSAYGGCHDTCCLKDRTYLKTLGSGAFSNHKSGAECQCCHEKRLGRQLELIIKVPGLRRGATQAVYNLISLVVSQDRRDPHAQPVYHTSAKEKGNLLGSF